MYLYGNNIRSRALSDRWVFYEDLIETRPSLAIHVSGQLDRIVENSQNFDKITNNLYRQAAAEYKREIALIKKEFGISNVPEDAMDDDAYSELVKAINFQLQSKAVFQRNLDRLYPKKANGEYYKTVKVDVTKFFWTYFKQAFDKHFANFQSLIDFRRGEPIDASISRALEEHMPKVIQEALILMYSSNVFTEQQNNKLMNDANQRYENETDNAYKELVNFLEASRDNLKENSLIQQIYRDYNFDKLISQLTHELLQKTSKNKKKSKKDRMAKSVLDVSKIEKTITSGSLSGLLAEAVQEQLVDLHLNLNNGTITTSVKRTGQSNQQKSDLTIGFEIDARAFEELQSNIVNELQEQNSTRMQNILATTNALDFFQHQSQGMSFLTFVNMKNYTLGDHFEGFSAGSAVNMENFYQWVQQIPTIGVGRANLLIAALLQFGEGAIGNEAQKEAVLTSLSELVAYFLFDDFATIGDEVKTNGVNTIHLFWLSGIYVPLSFLLKIFADSIKIGSNEAKDVVNFSLNSPKIMYGNKSTYTHEDWVNQRAGALRGTTLSMKFLKSFQELLLPLF